MKAYENIFLDLKPEVLKYTSKKSVLKQPKIPMRNTIEHGAFLKRKLEDIWNENSYASAITFNEREGTYLEFIGKEGYELNVKSLENMVHGIRLMNVREDVLSGERIIKATVFIPHGKESYFLKKIEEYLNNITSRGKPKNADLINSIENIKRAIVESFWLGKREWMPENNKVWCEIWLSSDQEEILNLFFSFLKQMKIEYKIKSLKFPERQVVLAKCNRLDLENIISNCYSIAEIHRATETARFFVEIDTADQMEWAKDLKERLTVESNDIYVSILDTGVNNGHILLKSSLSDKNSLSFSKSWGTNDEIGHGTNMAGIALFGNLKDYLLNQEEVETSHQLESFKMLKGDYQHEPELYGAVTSDAISQLIINNPKGKRIICMAITAPTYQENSGKPTSWSATIDSLVFGAIDEIKKIFVVSAGNVEYDSEDHYINENLVTSIENPGQSWNAITVGAYTNKVLFEEKFYSDDAHPLAGKNELSPYSTTSNTWDNKWPIKPDVVEEGGNKLVNNSFLDQINEFSSLTTHFDIKRRVFGTIWGTSAASAIVANMGAKLIKNYPDAWPETIRALIIHSASWTDEMLSQFHKNINKVRTNKTDQRFLLRTYGYGVPDFEKANRCASNSVNMILEKEIQPFYKTNKGVKTKDFHIFEIPWPKNLLEQLGNVKVNMKMTLSYYIEPGPGEIGWNNKYRYQSGGLRFEVNGSLNKNEFIHKISKVIETNDEKYLNNEEVLNSDVKWKLGPNLRNTGSIHSDVWEGSASDLALSNYIAIYPVVGWWKERTNLGKYNEKMRYSLIVSIQTPNSSVDLYTPIMNLIPLKTPVMVEVKHL